MLDQRQLCIFHPCWIGSLPFIEWSILSPLNWIPTHKTLNFVVPWDFKIFVSPYIYIDSVQFSHSVVSDSLESHELQHTRPPCPSPTSQSSPKRMSIELMIPSNHLILCHPLLLLPPIPPSIRVFSKELTLPMRWPKYWSFSFSIIPSKEIPGLISFRMD